MLVVMKQDRYGLGYKPDGNERKKQMKNRREKRMTNLKGTIVEGELMVFPHYVRPSIQLEYSTLISDQNRLPWWKILKS